MSQKSSEILKSINNKDLFVLPSVGGDIGISTVGLGISTLSKKWVGGCLGPDNTIYCIPHNAPNMLLINTENETITTQSLTGSGSAGPTDPSQLSKWAGGVLVAGVNPVVTAVNYTYTEFVSGFVIKPDLRINTYTKIVLGNGSNFPTSNTWFGGVLGTNNKVYSIPFDATFVQVGVAITFGSLPADSGKWSGGALAPNGKIYGIPHNSSTILEINPSVDFPYGTVTTFGSVGVSGGKWAGGVLGPNGKIYGIPYSSSSILEIDPATQTATTFGSLGVSGGKWAGGVLAPNGKIYGIPYNSSTILEIDPITRTATTFGSVGIGTQKWFGGVLAPNGKIYCIPHDSTTILTIGTPSTTEPAEWLLSSYCNKF
jgi:hypothetical protein